jgi:hypothetical protein
MPDEPTKSSALATGGDQTSLDRAYLHPARSAQCGLVDCAIAGLLALAAAAATLYGSRGIDARLIRGENNDVWFEADCPRVFLDATDSRSVQARSAVHPLSGLFTYSLVTALRWAGGLEPISAVRVLRALTAAACAVAFYSLLRRIGCRRLDAILFTLLAATSAAAMFWFVVPETYPAGLLTILLTLCLLAGGEGRRPSPGWDIVVNIGTFAFTITNWMAGLLATFVRWPLRQALRIILAALCFALTLMMVQHQLLPGAAIWPVSFEEGAYILPADAGGPVRVVISFGIHSMVMPAIGTIERYGPVSGPIMTVQHSWPGSAGTWGFVAVTLWALLLGFGVYGMYTCRTHRCLRIVLGLTIAGQLVVHVLYGLETFLYSCHFGPLLIVLAAFAALSKNRRVAVGLALSLILCAGINNARQLAWARAFVERRMPAATAARMDRVSHSYGRHGARALQTVRDRARPPRLGRFRGRPLQLACVSAGWNDAASPRAREKTWPIRPARFWASKPRATKRRPRWLSTGARCSQTSLARR